MDQENGFAPLFLLIGIFLIVVVGGYFIAINKVTPKACTQEAKLCPDGSYVSRTGPNCEFSPCPSVFPSNSPTFNKNISSDDAVQIVASLPEVKDFLKNTPKGVITFDHEDTQNNLWVIHVYENLPDHLATFNWYDVNKTTRVVKSEF